MAQKARPKEKNQSQLILYIKMEQNLEQLFKKWHGTLPDSIEPIAQSGSNRKYFKLSANTENGQKTAIGAYNNNKKENVAFIEFSNHFYAKELSVPQVYITDLDNHVYLQEDLGDKTLYGLLNEKRPSPDAPFPEELEAYYEQAVFQLLHFQHQGHIGLDYSICYPRPAFDKQSMLWDLNYFKYYFLKLANVPFDEQALEDDFDKIANYLLKIPADYFMHRDFQARNIMLPGDQAKHSICFIDYQGGRKGPLQYDLVSLLFQAKANLPYYLREKLLDFYIEHLKKEKTLNADSITEFKNGFYAIAYIRTIQVLGAYGFRGLYERKPHFIQSIPYALNNLRWLLENQPLAIELPELKKALKATSLITKFEDKKWEEKDKLTVRIHSFSYRRGIPVDPSGNGGGFVFDCRNIHNPGRYEPYKKLTGRDESVQTFLLEKSDINGFLNPIFGLVDSAVQTYIDRDFRHLMVSFGCTGGQHRSVYSADRLAAHLEEKHDIHIELEHIEQELKSWTN